MGAAPTRDERGAELAKERRVLNGGFKREGTRKSGKATIGCLASLPHFVMAMALLECGGQHCNGIAAKFRGC